MILLVRASAELVGLLISVATTVWVTRAVGPATFGNYAVMLVLVTTGSLVLNAGLSTVGSQRVVNEPEKSDEVFWAITVTRALVAVPAIVVAYIVLQAVRVPEPLSSLMHVGVLSWIALPFRVEWLLVAQGRVRAVSALRVASSALTLAVALAFVHSADDIVWLGLLSVITPLTAACIGFGIAARWIGFAPRGQRVRSTLSVYLRSGRHYLKADLSAFVFTSSDRIFLFVFATPTVVGLYDAAYRVIQPFYLISTVVGDATYRRIAETYGTPGLAGVFRRYVDLMCFATIPLGPFLMLFAPLVVQILYGDRYAGASTYLAVLGWVITFGYTSGVLVLPFTAWNKPREFGNANAIGGATNLVLNFALIPPLAALGAAWSTIAAKLSVTAAGLYYFPRSSDYPIARDFAVFGLASVVAWSSSLALSNGPVPAPLVFALAYLVVVAVARGQFYFAKSSTQLR